MSDRNKFDEFFKSSFEDYEPTVPGRIWDNIAAERKRRPAAAWWTLPQNILLLSALFTLLAAGGWWLLAAHHAPTAFAGKSNNDKPGTTSETIPARSTKNYSLDKPGAADETVNPSYKAAQTTAAPDNDPASSGASDGDGNRGDIGDRTGGNIARVQSEDQAANAGKYNRTHLGKGKLTYRSTRGNVEAEATNETGADDLAEAVAEPGTEAGIVQLLPVERDVMELLRAKNFDKNKIVLKAVPGPECPELDAAGNKSYVELYAGPDYAIKKYSDTGVSLINKRKESLSFRSAFSAGFRYTRVFENGMSVRGGLNFSQVNEKFSYLQANVVQVVYVINTNGDTTDTYYVRSSRYKTSSNRYRTIDIPLTVGYEMGNGKFHANINTGVVINVYSWQDGETLDNNFMPVSITTGKENNPYQYKTNVGLGFIGAASLYYKLNSRLHLMAEPYFRYNFSAMNKEAITLQEKFTTIGLRLGIRVDLR